MNEKVFRFEPEGHKYYLGDEELPSFSSIAAPLDDFSQIHPATLKRRAEEGSNIHLTIKLWLDKNLDEEKLSEGNKIAIELMSQFFDSARPWGALVEWEKPVYHKTLKYATTPDLVFEEAIVDIKTRPYNKHKDPVQLIAQSKCFPDFPPKSLWILALDIENGKYALQRAEDKQAWGVFRKLLEKRKLDMEIESLLKNWKEK